MIVNLHIFLQIRANLSFNNFKSQKMRFKVSIEKSFSLAGSYTCVPKFQITIFNFLNFLECCNTWRIYFPMFPFMYTEISYFKETPEGTTITDDALNFLPSSRTTASRADSYILPRNILRDSPNLLIRNILDSGI